MRIFIAVEIDEAVRRRAAQLSRAMALVLEQGGGRRRVGWVAPQNLHLTLGRVKSPAGRRLRDAIEAAGAADAGRCLVDHVTLFESRLSPSGATYSVIATSRLGYHHT